MLDPLAVARDFIHVWEDGGATDPARTHSLDRDDNGNWTGGVCGQGACVGSNHGVTAAALAAYRHVPVAAITLAVMRALTADEAAQIAVANFYRAPDLDYFVFDPTIASVFDFGWGAGPGQAIKTLQRLIGADDDGQIGPGTVAAYKAWQRAHGAEACATMWADARDAFYRQIVAKRPANAKYLAGWTRRTVYYRPGGAWWRRFTARAA